MFLLKKYQAHINIEFCNQSNVVKYLFKYVSKGPDQANVAFHKGKKRKPPCANTFLVNKKLKQGNTTDDPSDKDEIMDYIQCRCI
jgi:hypothetical protein